MKLVSFLGVLFLTFSFISGMEPMPTSVIFENQNGQKLAIPAQVVSKSGILNAIYQRHALLASIGTHSRVKIESAQLQNVELIQECIVYDSADSNDLAQRISIKNVTDIPHLIQVIHLSSYLGLDKKITTIIAQAISSLLQSPQNRYIAFKNGLLFGIRGKPEILNGIAQEIMKPSGAKYFWLMQGRNGNGKASINDAQEQLDNYLTPARALLLLDSYQNKVNGTAISYLPGDEKILPRALQGLVTLSFSQRMALGWQKAPATYKWTIAGTGTASLLAAGYGLYAWYTSK